MGTIDISVIIAIYCVEKYIEKCVRSLFNQTLKNRIEYIFVDDASTDHSLSLLHNILNEFPDRARQVRIIEHHVNRGLAAARNTGVSAAKGDYIIHCDSDDWVAPEMYERLLTKANSEKADVVFCDYIGVFNRKQIYFRQSPAPNVPQTLDKILDGTLHNGVWNKLIHRSLYESTTPLWQDGVNMWEDVSIIPRLIYFAKKISYVNKPLYFYNQTNTSSYTRRRSSQSAKQIDAAFTIVNDFFSSKPECKNADSLIKFKHRALYGILTRVPSGEAHLWIEKYNYNRQFLLHNPFSGLNNLIYNLYLKRHSGLARTILNITNRIKYAIR